jgi:hypothetical protein
MFAYDKFVILQYLGTKEKQIKSVHHDIMLMDLLTQKCEYQSM